MTSRKKLLDRLTRREMVLSWVKAVVGLSWKTLSMQARGAKIYCEMVGGGMTADAHHITAPHPEGFGARNVMQNALDDAGLSPKDIDYVNVHGTSTPLGDVAEVKAIQQVFGEEAYNLNISSTKSMTGHLLGAAGAVEAMACIMAIVDQVVPPTINHEHEDDQLDKLNLTLNQAQKREVRAALSNTFGFMDTMRPWCLKPINDPTLEKHCSASQQGPDTDIRTLVSRVWTSRSATQGL